METERKYLVTDVPKDLDAWPREDVAQGYIALTEDGTEVRVRRMGAKYYETVKTGQGLTRGETEIELDKGQFEKLWALTEGRRIEKTRYRIAYRGLVIELDVYRGRLKGLVTAEIEFGSAAESQSVDRPPWFGREVTNDGKYKNQYLAVHGVAD